MSTAAAARNCSRAGSGSPCMPIRGRSTSRYPPRVYGSAMPSGWRRRRCTRSGGGSATSSPARRWSGGSTAATWGKIGPEDVTTDLTELSFFTEIGWRKFGQQDLAAGDHAIELRIAKLKNSKGEHERLLFGLDALCLTPDPFLPNGKFKPGAGLARRARQTSGAGRLPTAGKTGGRGPGGRAAGRALGSLPARRGIARPGRRTDLLAARASLLAVDRGAGRQECAPRRSGLRRTASGIGPASTCRNRRRTGRSTSCFRRTISTRRSMSTASSAASRRIPTSISRST